jgi:hypothetical protein
MAQRAGEYQREIIIMHLVMYTNRLIAPPSAGTRPRERILSVQVYKVYIETYPRVIVDSSRTLRRTPAMTMYTRYSEPPAKIRLSWRFFLNCPAIS